MTMMILVTMMMMMMIDIDDVDDKQMRTMRISIIVLILINHALAQLRWSYDCIIMMKKVVMNRNGQVSK